MEINVRPASHRCRTLFAATIVTASLVAQATLVAQAPPKTDPKPDVAAGLPTFLLPVPAGDVVVGLSADQWLQAVRECVSPSRPEMADRDPKSTKKKLEQTSRALGQEVRPVRLFLLAKTPVTNQQYELFRKAMAARGEKVAPPFHWWYRGCHDDYTAKIDEIKKLFPGDGVMAPVLYWKRFGNDVPYALKDEFGKPIDDHPVVCVTKKDALRFAGWLGMRLPTEAERTRAVRGDSKNIWPWGSNGDVGDHYVEKVLKLLELDRVNNRHTRPVGSVDFLTGPFGHKDLTAHVWEYTSTVGLSAICGQKAYEVEWKRTQKDKFLSSLELMPPAWQDAGVVAKGASYLSWGNPVEFQIDSRVWMENEEVVEGVGFRLAKDLRPGYDLLVSLCSSDFNQELFQTGKDDQKVDFEVSVGCERYALDDTGFPTEYHATVAAGLNWMTTEKALTLQKLEEASQASPLLVGAVACTDPVLQPKLSPGVYSLAYRKGGVPKDLKEKWIVAVKELQKRKTSGADKATDASSDGKAEDGKGKPDDSKGKGEDGKGEGKKDDGKGEGKSEGKGEKSEKKDEVRHDWRSVLARYGLTEKDVENAIANDDGKCTFVRIDDYQLPVDEDYFLFHDNAGKFVAHCKASGLTLGNLGPAELTIGQATVDKAERQKLTFKVRVPLLKDQKKGVEYTLELILEQGPPAAGVTWRTPAVK